MKLRKKHQNTLRKIKAQPALGTIHWDDIESLFVALGATIQERGGSAVAIVLKNQVHAFHRPHPSPDTYKRTVKRVKGILETDFPELFAD